MASRSGGDQTWSVPAGTISTVATLGAGRERHDPRAVARRPGLRVDGRAVGEHGPAEVRHVLGRVDDGDHHQRLAVDVVTATRCRSARRRRSGAGSPGRGDVAVDARTPTRRAGRRAATTAAAAATSHGQRRRAGARLAARPSRPSTRSSNPSGGCTAGTAGQQVADRRRRPRRTRCRHAGQRSRWAAIVARRRPSTSPSTSSTTSSPTCSSLAMRRPPSTIVHLRSPSGPVLLPSQAAQPGPDPRLRRPERDAVASADLLGRAAAEHREHHRPGLLARQRAQPGRSPAPPRPRSVAASPVASASPRRRASAAAGGRARRRRRGRTAGPARRRSPRCG